MATAGDLIEGALRLIGALADGETPSGAMGADALATFNSMIDSWSTERLSVFALDDQAFTWPANTTTRTMGPTGQLSGTRPVRVEDGTYFVQGTLSYPLQLINKEQYDGISLKSSTSTFPQVMYVNMTMPDIELTMWPVPTSAIELHVVSVEVLTQPAALATTLAYPPGYERALRYNLACELAPEYGVAPSRQVLRIADVSKRNLKRINNPMDVMSMPYALVARQQRFNIFSGQ